MSDITPCLGFITVGLMIALSPRSSWANTLSTLTTILPAVSRIPEQRKGFCDGRPEWFLLALVHVLRSRMDSRHATLFLV